MIDYALASVDLFNNISNFDITETDPLFPMDMQRLTVTLNVNIMYLSTRLKHVQNVNYIRKHGMV